jgi:hypothetical protein
MKELVKLRKCVYSLSSPLGMMSAKRYTPRIEKIKFIKISSIPIFNIAGKQSMKVIMVFFSDWLLLKKKKIRTILKDLMTVVCVPKDESLLEFITIPDIVSSTITISKMFQES